MYVKCLLDIIIFKGVYMFKKTLLSLVVSLGLTSGLVANDELKADMGKLASSIVEAQMGFFANDQKATLAAVMKLKKESAEFLGNKETITALLPENVKHKASIAINSAEMITKHANDIEKTLNDRSMNMINKQMRTQKSFAEIQHQCFRCHNLVRDWQ